MHTSALCPAPSWQYLRFRNASDLAPLAGAPVGAVRTTAAWLRALGGEVVEVSALRDRVTARFPGGEPLPLESWSVRGLPHRVQQPQGVLLVTRRDFGAAVPTCARESAR